MRTVDIKGGCEATIAMEEREGKGEKTYVPGDVTLVTSEGNEGNEAFDGIGFE